MTVIVCDNNQLGRVYAYYDPKHNKSGTLDFTKSAEIAKKKGDFDPEHARKLISFWQLKNAKTGPAAFARDIKE